MKILGIDLAGNEKNKTGICILNGKTLKADCFSVFKDKDILKIAKKERPKLIAIDAPLSLPQKRKSLKKKEGIHFRKCDKELWKFGIKFFPITLGPMRNLTERGIRLKKKLKKYKFAIIEVYPGATQDILKIPRKQKGLKKLKKGLEKYGLEFSKTNLNGDELDAATAAFTGLFYLKKKFLALGEKREGQIILPNFLINFLNSKILTSPGVFEPRAETKFWVKKVIKKLMKEKNKIKVLDIFAGTGIIGIAILKNVKNSTVDFIDIDKKALNQIKINLKLNKIKKERWKIYFSNIFQKIKRKKYNFIFANPPYVAKERIFEVQNSVKEKEPKISWYGGKKGLKIIKKFLAQAKNYLKKGGKIFMEFDPFQKKDIEIILKKEKYSAFKFHKDQFKKWRWVEILK